MPKSAPCKAFLEGNCVAHGGRESRCSPATSPRPLGFVPRSEETDIPCTVLSPRKARRRAHVAPRASYMAPTWYSAESGVVGADKPAASSIHRDSSQASCCAAAAGRPVKRRWLGTYTYVRTCSSWRRALSLSSATTGNSIPAAGGYHEPGQDDDGHMRIAE
jgi:hypothetical protein